jgi:hypothetical protein
MLVFQVALGVFLGGVSLFAAFRIWMAWRMSPVPEKQPFDWKRATKVVLVYLASVSLMLGYVVLADLNKLPCWMLFDDSDWRASAGCE